jgi:hypothetical protein
VIAELLSSIAIKIAKILIVPVLKKAGLGWLPKTIGLVSSFEQLHDAWDCYQSWTHCDELRKSCVRVISDEVTDRAIEAMLKYGRSQFNITRTSAGLYLATEYEETRLPTETWGGGTFWDYCSALNCTCNLPKVCLDSDCDCTRRKVCGREDVPATAKGSARARRANADVPK